MKHVNKFNFKPKKLQITKSTKSSEDHEHMSLGKKNLKLENVQEPHGHYFGKKWYPN